MLSATVNSYRYIKYTGCSAGLGGFECPESVFKDLTESALSWAKDKSGNIIYLRDDLEPTAHTMMFGSHQLSLKEAFDHSQALIKKGAPEGTDLIDEEFSSLQDDPYFSGFSLLTSGKTLTRVPDVHMVWGIHKSGLLFGGNEETHDMVFSENLFRQFHVLVIERNGRPIRVFNSQNKYALEVLRVRRKSPIDPSKIQELLGKIEKEFIHRHSCFRSKFDFLEKTSLSTKSKKDIKALTEGSILITTDELLNLLLREGE